MTTPNKYPTTPMCDGAFLEMFEPTVRDSDVFIATVAKSGQTWLQSILYHLKTRGHSPDYGGQSLQLVTPWLELPTEIGFAVHPAERKDRLAWYEKLDDPRIFKMHVIWEEIPRPPGSKAKVITITRDPRELPYSMYCHLLGLKNRPEGINPDDFDSYFERWMDFGFFFQFVTGFWPHRDDDDVLWLRYSDLKANLAEQCRVIVDFLGWETKDEDIERVLPLVDIARMRSKEKERNANKPSIWRPEANFYRQGGVGKNRAQLSESQEQRILDRVRAELPPDSHDFLLTLPPRS